MRLAAVGSVRLRGPLLGVFGFLPPSKNTHNGLVGDRERPLINEQVEGDQMGSGQGSSSRLWPLVDAFGRGT